MKVNLGSSSYTYKRVQAVNKRPSQAKVGDLVNYYNGKSRIAKILPGGYIKTERGDKIDLSNYRWNKSWWEWNE